MRKAAVKHPIATSIIIILLFMFAMLLGSLLLAVAPPFFYRNGDFLAQFVAESVVCLFGAALVGIFGYGRIWGEADNFGRGLITGGYFIVTGILSAFSQLVYEAEERGSAFFSSMLPAWRIAIFFLTCFLIGLAEEAFFRGVVANLFWDKHAKDPAGVWTATIYSGIIFGLMHFINIFSSDLSGVLVQMTAVIAMGMTLTAIYYRTRNIWVVIFVHAFLDLCAMFSTGLFGGTISGDISSYNPIMAITSSLPYIIVTLVLLRKKKVIGMFTPSVPVMVNGQETMMPAGFDSHPGALVTEVSMPSSPDSKKSRNKAVIILIVLMLVMFAACVLTSPMLDDMIFDLTGSVVLDYHDTGVAGGEDTVGKTVKFYVDDPGQYKVTLITVPSASATDMLIQLKQGEETVYEATYGGKCSDIFSVYLEPGEYELISVYSFSRVEDPDAEYDLSVKIVPDKSE